MTLKLCDSEQLEEILVQMECVEVCRGVSWCVDVCRGMPRCVVVCRYVPRYVEVCRGVSRCVVSGGVVS